MQKGKEEKENLSVLMSVVLDNMHTLICMYVWHTYNNLRTHLGMWIWWLRMKSRLDHKQTGVSSDLELAPAAALDKPSKVVWGTPDKVRCKLSAQPLKSGGL